MKKYFVAICFMLFTAVAMIAGNVNTGNYDDVGTRYQDESSGSVVYAMNVGISLPVKNVEVATYAECTDVGSINQFEDHQAVSNINDTSQKLRKKRAAANMTRAVTYYDTGEQNQKLLS